MQRQRGRRAEGLANDERIFDAATTLLDERGVDGLGATELARAAGLTSGAFYARYADVAEMLADLWARRIAGSFRSLALEASRLADAWPDLDPHDLAELLASSPQRRVAFEMLAASARIDELGDVVPRSVRETLEEAGLGSDREPSPGVAGLALLGLALGSAAHERIEGSLVADAGAIVRWAASGAGREPGGPAPAPYRIPPVSFVPVRDGVSEPDLRRRRLLDAATAVVGRSGIARANLRRISRAAGYAHTAIYQEYANLHELIVDLVRTVTDANAQTVPTLEELVDPDAEAGRLGGLLAPGARQRRRLALEFWIGSAHDPALATLTAASDREADEAVADRLAEAQGSARAAAVRHRVVRRHLAFGLMALEEGGADLGGRDWRPFASALLLGLLPEIGTTAAARPTEARGPASARPARP